jgi:predicted short-subunit dehydrogenase-like oxidoreductase (DUF2520 family)
VKVCVFGRGKVGTALARGFENAQLAVTLLKGTPPWRKLPACDVYVLAVPDAALRSVSEHLGPLLPASAIVLHCAGARTHEELTDLRQHGAAVGVLHPLVSFADKKRPPQLVGATFVFQGDARAERAAKALARAVRAHFIRSDRLGPAYHAAAALVANASVALANTGLEILLALGFPRGEATRALAGLLTSVAANVAQVGLPRALTGPVVRGDAATVSAHLDALAALDPALASSYASLQGLVLRCALQAGLPTQAAQRVRRAAARPRKAQRKT